MGLDAGVREDPLDPVGDDDSPSGVEEPEAEPIQWMGRSITGHGIITKFIIFV